MRTENYEKMAMRTCRHTPGSTQAIIEAALGLCGESGEVADIVKKTMFGGHTMDREKIILEMGDVMWYLAEMAWGLGTSLDEVMLKNIAKLQTRYPKGYFTTKDSVQRKDVKDAGNTGN